MSADYPSVSWLFVFMPTYKQIQDDVLDRLNQDNSTTTSAARTRLKRFINEWYRRILAQPFMSRVRDSALTITTAAGTAEYTLAATQIREVYDATNDWKLEPRSLDWIRERDPGSDVTGSPQVYAIKSQLRATTVIVLWPLPSAIATIKVDAESVTTEMSGDSDLPIIPEDFHYLIGDGALINEYLRIGDMERAQWTRQSLEKGLRDLRVRLNTVPSGSIVPGRQARISQGRSRLGSNYPADF